MAEETTEPNTSHEPQEPRDEAPEKEAESTASAPEAEADLEDGEVSKDEAAKAQEDPEESTDEPPLPNETLPPLPNEAPPLPTEAAPQEDDGWAPVWEESAQAFYFYNRFTGATTWENPRVPSTSASAPTSTPAPPPGLPTSSPQPPAAEPTGYNPAIHGDYDPTAWYAQPAIPDSSTSSSAQPNPSDPYAATAAFNRFTGRFQNADLAPENFNDENKSRRQMNAFFDVDAAANSHDGKSLKAERSGKKLSKTELKSFKEKRKMKKEEKRRAWLRD